MVFTLATGAKQVLRAGLASALRPATSRGHSGEWGSHLGSPAGLLFPALGRARTFPEEPSQRRPALQISRTSSWDKSPLAGVGIPWHQTGPLGTRSLPFLSAHPVVHIHGPLGPWHGCWLEGRGERARPLGGLTGSPASLKRMEPPGPMINISSMGGILQPSRVLES